MSTIADIVQNELVGSQAELCDKLKARGLNTTQATLSRDLRALKIVKLPDNCGGYVYRPANEDRSQQTLSVENGRIHLPPGFVSMTFSGHLAVIKTRPGYATAIASDIDGLDRKEILGTIAGDDTLLLVSRNGTPQTKILQIISTLAPQIPSGNK
jgi:transcriptional regulator of arginine metabolism